MTADVIDAGDGLPLTIPTLLRERVAAAGLAGDGQLREPAAATDEELGRAHDRA